MGPRVTAAVLAAGEGRRMGASKLLLPWGEATVLDRTLAQLERSSVTDILVVTGHDAEAVAVVARAHGARTIHNPDYASGGMLSSLRLAVGCLAPEVEGVLVALADQPMVETATIDALVSAFRSTGAGFVAPVHAGRRGNPVLIARRHFAALAALPAGAAPRALLARHPEDLRLVAVESEAVLCDIDRPEDYRRWRPADTRSSTS